MARAGWGEDRKGPSFYAGLGLHFEEQVSPPLSDKPRPPGRGYIAVREDQWVLEEAASVLGTGTHV